MKTFLKCLAVVFVLGALFFVQTSTAYAAYACVEVYKFKCLMCDIEVYTFAPDNLEPKDGKQKEKSFQKSEWFMLSDYSKAFIDYKNCKNNQGHVFDKKGSSTISPKDVSKYRNQFVVLKNGSNINGRGIEQVKCMSCGKSDFLGFAGDGMGMERLVLMTSKLELDHMNGSGSISECGTQLVFGFNAAKAHLFKDVKVGSMSSYQIAKNFSILYYAP